MDAAPAPGKFYLLITIADQGEQDRGFPRGRTGEHQDFGVLLACAQACTVGNKRFGAHDNCIDGCGTLSKDGAHLTTGIGCAGEDFTTRYRSLAAIIITDAKAHMLPHHGITPFI
jgi:hypothetical protein